MHTTDDREEPRFEGRREFMPGPMGMGMRGRRGPHDPGGEHRGGPHWRGPHGGPPPFGGFGGPRFGRMRKTGRGDVRTAALSLLAEQPLHGYQIIQEIAERSGGAWKPSAGSIYPALQQLADEGLVRAEESEGRRVFHLTETGRTYVSERQEELAAVWEDASDPAGDGMRELRDLVGQVAMAAMQVAQAGTDTQISAARQILTNTRRQLYRILAEEDAPVGEQSTSNTAQL